MCLAMLGADMSLVLPGTASATTRPTVTGVSPNDGPIGGGTSVTITGTGFTGATEVKFGSSPAASFTVNSDESITAVSPSNPPERLLDITVTGPGGMSDWTLADKFGYGPIATQFEPDVGPAAGGTAVRISGFGLTGATAVDFGSHPAASFAVNPDGSIAAVSPPSAGGPGQVRPTVTTPEGASVFVLVGPECLACWPAGYFWYGPKVTEVTPRSGPEGGGTTVTVRGANFLIPWWQSASIAVDFGSKEATEVHLKSETELTAVSPPGKGTVDVKILTGPGTSPTSPADRFAYALSANNMMPPSVGAWGETTPSKLPRSHPRPIRLRVGFTSKGPTGGSPTPELNRISIEVSRNVIFDARGLPSCPLAKLFSSYASPLQTCPGSLVGRGGVVSEVTLPGHEPVMIDGKLLAFYDFAKGRPRILAQVTSGGALPLTYVIPFQIGKARGPFGTRLLVPTMRNIQGKCANGHPHCFAQPYSLKGIYSHIARFELSLRRRFERNGRRESFIAARCPAPSPRSSASFPLERLSLHYSTEGQASGVVRRRCEVRSR